MYMLIILCLTALEAIYEGLYDKGIKALSGVIELIYKVILYASLILMIQNINLFNSINKPGILEMVIGFLFVRFALFDMIYNITRGNPLFYLGTTKLYDRILSKTGSWGWFVKGCCLIVSFFLLFNY